MVYFAGRGLDFGHSKAPPEGGAQKSCAYDYAIASISSSTPGKRAVSTRATKALISSL